MEFGHFSAIARFQGTARSKLAVMLAAVYRILVENYAFSD